jgi:hypothetical protein
LASFIRTHRALSRYGSSALTRRYLSASSGRASRSVVAADPGAERERARGRWQRHAEVGQRLGQVLENLRRGLVGQVGQVVDGVAGLVGRLGTLEPQFVGLPQQVDHLGEAAVGVLPVCPAVDGGGPGLGLQLVGHLAQLAEDRAASRLGGVCREHRTDRQPADRGAELPGRDPPVGDQLGGTVQPAAGLAAGPAQVPRPVHLLDDVGQVEVGGEGTGEHDAGRHVQPGQPVRGGAPVDPHQSPDLLDEVEQRPALLPGEGVAEQRAEPADV